MRGKKGRYQLPKCWALCGIETTLYLRTPGSGIVSHLETEINTGGISSELGVTTSVTRKNYYELSVILKSWAKMDEEISHPSSYITVLHSIKNDF